MRLRNEQIHGSQFARWLNEHHFADTQDPIFILWSLFFFMMCFRVGMLIVGCIKHERPRSKISYASAIPSCAFPYLRNPFQNHRPCLFSISFCVYPAHSMRRSRQRTIRQNACETHPSAYLWWIWASISIFRRGYLFVSYQELAAQLQDNLRFVSMDVWSVQAVSIQKYTTQRNKLNTPLSHSHTHKHTHLYVYIQHIELHDVSGCQSTDAHTRAHIHLYVYIQHIQLHDVRNCQSTDAHTRTNTLIRLHSTHPTA